jgi:Zn-dependent protease
MKEYLVYILAQFLAVAIVLTFHEFAHAYAAYKNGDPTAKFSGRLTLNPAKHFDPIGVIMFAVAGFGWAKPVPVNPNNFRNYRKGCFWTSIAGVLTNYVMAFIFCPIFILVATYVCPKFDGLYMEQFLYTFFSALFACSLSFCVFNLLPLYPLDGFRIVDAVSTKRGKVYQFLRQNGYYILLGLILVHVLSGRIPYLGYVDVLGYILNFAIDIFGKPITLFWEWIFNLFLGN